MWIWIERTIWVAIAVTGWVIAIDRTQVAREQRAIMLQIAHEVIAEKGLALPDEY